MRKRKINRVDHYMQLRNQSSDMWTRVYNRFLKGQESVEMLLMAMTVLNSADEGICNATDISSEEKNIIWSTCR